MRAHQFELSTEALDFYGRALNLLENRVVIVSTEEVNFYGTGIRFCKKDQGIVSTEEALDSPRNDRRFVRNDIDFCKEQFDLRTTHIHFSKKNGIVLKK